MSERTGIPLSTLAKVEHDRLTLTYDKLLLRIEHGLERARLAQENQELRQALLGESEIIGESPVMAKLKEQIEIAAPTDGWVLINSRKTFDELGLADLAARFRRERLITVPATEIALKHVGRPLPNAVLLGGFAALSGLAAALVLAAVKRRRPGLKDRLPFGPWLALGTWLVVLYGPLSFRFF